MAEFNFKIGDIVETQVTKIHDFGAQVRLSDNTKGLIHISQISDDFVKDINDYLKVGDKVTARINKISPDGKIDLTLKKRKQEPVLTNTKKEFKGTVFQQKLEEFLSKDKTVPGEKRPVL